MSEANAASAALPRENQGYFSIWATAVPVVTICVVTLSANGAILNMFICRRGLRRWKNLYFVSLALADFLVGLTMPYKLSKDLHSSWSIGLGCLVYQSIKQSLTYISFLSIFLITWDKWRAVHYPVSYRKKSTKYVTILAVVFIWLISFCIFTAPLFWWENLIIYRTEASSVHLAPTENRNNFRPDDQIRAESNASKNQNLSSVIRFHIKSGDLLHQNHICPEGYHLSIKLSIFSTTLYYILPLFAMFIFDLTLFFKIKWRKSVEVQRSTSVTDTYFLTLKKPPESCLSIGTDADSNKESLLNTADTKLINKHLAIGNRGERRHSSLPTISPVVKGRTSSGRRVSMPESDSGGGCRYVGRKWSGCASVFGNNQTQPPNPMANLAPRPHNEDIVHDILEKQDKTTARCICLLLGVLFTCWLPHAVVSIINARCWCLFGATITATSWFYQLDHAINPLLYGVMYVQFKNVFKQWLLIERVHAFKMRDTLILKNLQKKFEDEESIKQKSPNPQTKQMQFELPQSIPQLDSTLLHIDNTAL